MTEYKVRRQHIGDKEYFEGDTREADAAVVAHLVQKGILEACQPVEADAAKPVQSGNSELSKAELPARNKAARAPRNKAR